MTFWLFSLLLATPSTGQVAYARPEMLIEASALMRRGESEPGVLLDARPRTAYEGGHIPGALLVDVDMWSKAFASSQEPTEWSKRLGALGIDRDSPVVVYDESISGAARVWTMLRYFGVTDVRLLNGGWRSWTQAGGATSKEPGKPRSATPKLTPTPTRLTAKQDLLDLLKKGRAKIIDTRSPEEYRGDKALARRGGSIPGASHLEWTELLDPKTKKFRPADELAGLFRVNDIRLDRPCVTYCQSGGRASVMAFALELMGGTSVSNYYRSWAEWGNDDATPIIKPAPKP